MSLPLPVRFLAYAFAGWAIENAYASAWGLARYSQWWGGRRIPLLPIYGAGGLLAERLAPYVRGYSLPVRGVAYGAGLSAFEWVACHLDRAFFARPSWDYDGCIDLRHALAWSALGLLTEWLHASRA